MKTAEAKILPASSHQGGKREPFFGHQQEAAVRSIASETAPFFSKPVSVQAKLTVGQPNDKYEQEADAVADKVVQKLSEPETVQAKQISPSIPSIQAKCAECEKEDKLQKKEEELGKDEHKENGVKSAAIPNPPDPPVDNKEKDKKGIHLKPIGVTVSNVKAIQPKPIFESDAENPVQKKCDQCEKEEKLQKKESGQSDTASLPNIESRLDASKGSGTSLPDATRRSMESSMGADFSNVKVHTDSGAVQMSKDLNAQAFTHGSDIYFNSGKYDPSSKSGQHLLAHELTHTVQQGAANTNMVNKAGDDKPTPEGKDIKDMDNAAIAAIDKPKEGYIKKENGKIEIHFSDLPSKHYVGPFLQGAEPGPGEVSKQYFAVPPFLKPNVKRNTKQGKVWKDKVSEVIKTKFNERVAGKGIKGPRYQLNVIGNKNISVTGTIEEIANQVAVPLWTLDKKSIKYQIEHKVDWQVAGGSHDVDVISNLILLDSKTNNVVGQTILATMKKFYGAIVAHYTKKAVNGIDADFEAGKGKYSIYTDNLVSGDKLQDAFMISFSNITSSSIHMNPYSDERVDIIEEKIPPGHLSLKTANSGAGNIVPYNFENEFMKIDGDAGKHTINSIILYQKNFIKDASGKSVLDKGGNKTVDSQNPDKKLDVRGDPEGNPLQDHFKVDSFGFSTYLKDNIRGIKALSPIEWENVDFNPMTGLNAKGKIITNVELLDKADITIEVENSNFLIQAVVTSDALNGKLPKPFNIDYTSLTIAAGTKDPFSLTGALGFSIEKLGKGKLAAMAGVNKIGLEGSFLFDQIKQLKKAELGFKYIKQGEETHWEISGDLEVAKDAIKGVESGSLKVKYDGNALTGEGEAKLTVPGIDKVKINASFGNDGSFTITGGVELKKLPGIKSGQVQITVASKEGEGLKLGVTGEAEPDLPKVPDLNTKLLISYQDGAFEMRTKVQYKKGKFKGNVEVGITNKKVDEKGKTMDEVSEKGDLVVFGFGELSVELYKGINGSVKVRLTPGGEVFIGGVIEANNLKPFGDGYNFEKDIIKFPRIKIPLVGIPGVSIFAFIDGGVHFKFNWDPLVLKLLKVDFKETNINELDRISLEITGDVGSNAHAEVYMAINAGIGAEVLIASITGSIGGEAGLGLEAEAGGKLDATWDMEKGLKFKEIRAYLNVTPKAIFRLTGSVSVDLDLWVTTVNLYYHKWVFAEQQLDLSGLTLNLDFPIKFKEEGGIELPSYESMNVQKPDFSGDQGQKVLDTAINGDAQKELEQKKREIREKIRTDLRSSTNDEDFTPSKYTEKMMDKYENSPELQAYVKTTIEEESSKLEYESFEKQKQQLKADPMPLQSKLIILDMFGMFHRYVTREDVEAFKGELKKLEEEKMQTTLAVPPTANTNVPQPANSAVPPAGNTKVPPAANTAMPLATPEQRLPLQKKADHTGNRDEFISKDVADKLSGKQNSGTALPADIKNEMNNSFQTDFSNVKIHTDNEAADMSRKLNAQAFTHGNDIYFNQGKYNPETKEGKHLLAHELTHTIQQGSSNQIQRTPGDKHDLTSTSLGGDPILESTFDNETVVGKFSHSNGEHVKRIQQALISLGIELPKFGADEKFGTETENGVKEFQQKAGMSPKEWDGIVGRKTIGLLDRSLRNGAISTDTDKAEDDLKVDNPKKEADDEACKGKSTEKPCPDPNKTVNTAADEAIKLIDKVLDEQLPPVKNKKADYPEIFTRIFRNGDSRDIGFKVDEVRKNYEEIKKFLGRIKKEKDLVRCATECDGGCRSGSPAYHSAPGGKHIITFCPDFEKDDKRILIVLHECHHASIPGSSDKAYADTRLFEKLDHNKALLNAASFHVYAAWVEKPGSESIGPDVKDTNLIADKAQKDKTDLALAFMEQWFRLVTFDISETIQGAQEAKDKGHYTKKNPRVFMELVFSKWFGMNRPPLAPTELDIKKLKAIENRTVKMEKTFSSPFVIIETPNQSFWTNGPGNDMALNQNVLSLDMQHLVIALLQELVHATPNISAESEPLYVGTINDMRNLRELDP